MANAVQRFFREWGIERRRKRERATVDVREDHLVFTRRRKPLRVNWADVSQVDAGVMALVSGDLLYVTISATNVTRLMIDEFVDGFAALENALFARWPQIREKWNELHRAHTHQDILVTLWKRD